MSTQLPYMRLFVGDWLADTPHLKALEQGAYFLLVIELFRRGATGRAGERSTLPNNAKVLCQVARVHPDEWSNVWSSIRSLFIRKGRTISHKRVDAELLQGLTRKAVRAAAGKQGGLASAGKRKKSGTAKLGPSSTVGSATKRAAKGNDGSSILQHQNIKTTVAARASARERPEQ